MIYYQEPFLDPPWVSHDREPSSLPGSDLNSDLPMENVTQPGFSGSLFDYLMGNLDSMYFSSPYSSSAGQAQQSPLVSFFAGTGAANNDEWVKNQQAAWNDTFRNELMSELDFERQKKLGDIEYQRSLDIMNKQNEWTAQREDTELERQFEQMRRVGINPVAMYTASSPHLGTSASSAGASAPHVSSSSSGSSSSGSYSRVDPSNLIGNLINLVGLVVMGKYGLKK